MDQPFNVGTFRANAFTDAADFATGRLDVDGLTEEGELRTHQLRLTGLTLVDQLTRQNITYTDLVDVSLWSINFTYTMGNDQLRFLITIEGTRALETQYIPVASNCCPKVIAQKN